VASASPNANGARGPVILTFLEKLSDIANSISIWGTVVAMAAMTIIVFVQVVARFILNNALPWPEEISRYLMIWMCFLGSAIAVKRGEHIGLTLIRDRIPKKAQTFVGIAVNLGALVFLAYAAYYGFSLAKTAGFQRAPASRISMSWAYAAIPVGCTFMVIHTLVNLFQKPSESGIVSNL